MPRLDLNELKALPTEEPVTQARRLGVPAPSGLGRQQLIFEILRIRSHDNAEVTGGGVLEILADGFGFLRDPAMNYLPGPDDIYVSPSQIRRFNLRTGDEIAGVVRSPKEGERYFALIKVEALNGQNPEQSGAKVAFDNLTPQHPRERLRLEHDPEDHTSRMLDLFTPIGKGQRGLLISPARGGRTNVLCSISKSLATNHPELYRIVLLIDERPEDVTELRRALSGEVVASTFDEPAARHVQVAEMVFERARRLVENGRDVVVLLDSLTKLSRAYNQVVPSSGKLLGGTLDPAALHRPKRFFGAARSLEEGGSLTVLATVLSDTGAKMDEIILDEFQGTGNMELVLDRRVAARRVFPATNLAASGTRRDELLYAGWEMGRVALLRQALQGDPLQDMEWLARAMAQFPTNREMLEGMTG